MNVSLYISSNATCAQVPACTHPNVVRIQARWRRRCSQKFVSVKRITRMKDVQRTQNASGALIENRRILRKTSSSLCKTSVTGSGLKRVCLTLREVISQREEL